MKSRRGRRIIATGLLLAGGLLTVQGGWIQAKAVLAQLLLASAWSATLADGQVHRPWPWADHWPVAELSMPRLKARYIVLEGDAGHSLAFAPGHAEGSGMPGEALSTVISGHRDTHFRMLKDLRPGDAITVRTRDGRFRYRVVAGAVHDLRQGRLSLSRQDELLLVTCWPIEMDATSGPQRYVLRAVPAAGAARSATANEDRRHQTQG